ncbi:zinc ribbon domain-containing protein [Elusimicrobiota bacterium]
MPVYEYKCTKCGDKFEFLLLPGREDKVVCPKCASGDIEKQLTVFRSTKNSRSSSGADAQGTCCGMSNPCDSPKKCCGS